MIKVGPAGIGGVKEAEKNLDSFKENGLDVAEVAFTYGVYLKEDAAKRIGKTVKKNKIELSIHAPYYINLNSADKSIVKKSKKRIIDCCRIGYYLGAKRVVFHPGYYGKREKEETYENIKKEIKDIMRSVKKWKIILCPETTGKVNVFGSLDDIFRLVKDIGCGFCIDFAHLKARNKGNMKLKEVVKRVKKYKYVHCHYSGINYGAKGERSHKGIDLREWKRIVSELKKAKINCGVICEAPSSVNDAIKMKSVL